MFKTFENNPTGIYTWRQDNSIHFDSGEDLSLIIKKYNKKQKNNDEDNEDNEQLPFKNMNIKEVLIVEDILENKYVGDFLPYVCNAQNLRINFLDQVRPSTLYHTLYQICHFTNLTNLKIALNFDLFKKNDELSLYTSIQTYFPLLESLEVCLENVSELINIFFSRITKNIKKLSIKISEDYGNIGIKQFELKQFMHYNNIQSFSFESNIRTSGYQYLQNIFNTTKIFKLKLFCMFYDEDTKDDFCDYLAQFISSSEHLQCLEIFNESSFMDIQFILQGIKQWPISLQSLSIGADQFNDENEYLQEICLDFSNLGRITPQLQTFELKLNGFKPKRQKFMQNYLQSSIQFQYDNSEFQDYSKNKSGNLILNSLGKELSKCQNLQILQLQFGSAFQAQLKSFQNFFSKIAIKGLKQLGLSIQLKRNGYIQKEEKNQEQSSYSLEQDYDSEQYSEDEEESEFALIQENNKLWADYFQEIKDNCDFEEDQKKIKQMTKDEDIQNDEETNEILVKQEEKKQKNLEIQQDDEEIQENPDILEGLKILKEMTEHKIQQDQENTSEDQYISSNQNNSEDVDISEEIFQNPERYENRNSDQSLLLFFLLDRLYQNCNDSLISLKLNFEEQQILSESTVFENKVMKFNYLQNFDLYNYSEFEFVYFLQYLFKCKTKLLLILKKLNDISKTFNIRKEMLYDAIQQFIKPFNHLNIFETK